MKILIVMGGFFPGQKYGGPPVSVDNFCSLLKDEAECFILTRNHDKDENIPYESIQCETWIKRDNCYVKYVTDKHYRKKEFEKTLLEINPNIIYLQGLFQSCVLPCLELAKQYGIKVILAPRGELCAGAFKKKYKKIPYILYLNTKKLTRDISYQSTSEEETEAIKKYLKADQTKIHYLTNIPSIPKKKYVRESKKSGEAKLVFVSRIHPKKNLLSAIDYMKDVHGKVIFDIYGPIEDEEYWKQCNQKMSELSNNVTVQYCGLVKHEKIHEIFSQYNAFLFPTFSENYGHVIAEALSVGTPVIISDRTPWNDINSLAGWAIALDNSKEFCQAIQEVVNWDNNVFAEKQKNVCRYFTNKSQISIIKSEYKELLYRL